MHREMRDAAKRLEAAQSNLRSWYSNNIQLLDKDEREQFMRIDRELTALNDYDSMLNKAVRMAEKFKDIMDD